MASLRIGVCALGLGLSVGCEVVQEGQQGNFYFRYDSEGVFPFSTDIAVDARADIGVYYDEEATLPVDSLLFDVDGSSFSFTHTGNVITAEGLSEGAATIVVTDDDGVEDQVEIEAREADTVELRFPNPFNLTEGAGVFVAGGHARVPFDLKDGDSMLVGFGFPGFTASPNTVTITDGSAEHDLNFQHVTFAGVGEVTLGHPLAQDLVVEVVPVADIVSLDWHDFGGAQSLAVGANLLLFLDARTTDGVHVLGLDGVGTIASMDEGVCTVEHSMLWGDSVYEITGVGVGGCQVDAVIGDETATFTTTVEDS